MRPLEAIRWSDSVVLPWSTCARMHMLRMRGCMPDRGAVSHEIRDLKAYALLQAVP